MDMLPHTVEGAITLFFSILAATVAGCAKVAQVLRKRDERRMLSVPPTQPTAALERRLDTIEREVLVQRAKWREEELVEKLGELQKTLDELSSDQGRMAHALAGERQRAQRVEARLAVELELKRMLENRLAEALYAKEKAERERDAAVRTAQALRSGS